jgi:hypothetical protein
MSQNHKSLIGWDFGHDGIGKPIEDPMNPLFQSRLFMGQRYGGAGSSRYADFADVVAGAGSVTVTIVFSDASTIAATIGHATISAETVDITALWGPEWALQLEKEIVAVRYTVTEAFTVPNGTLTDLHFYLTIPYGDDPALRFAEVNCLAPLGELQTVTMAPSVFPNFAQPITIVCPAPPAHGAGLVGTVDLPALNTAEQSANIDIWGLDPRMPMALTLFRQEILPIDESAPALYNKALLTARLEAWTIRKDARGMTREVAPLESVTAWQNGGVLDANYDDGIELKTGCQGVRIKVFAHQADLNHMEIAATLSARPDVALGCRELSELIGQAGIKVFWPMPQLMAEGAPAA